VTSLLASGVIRAVVFAHKIQKSSLVHSEVTMIKKLMTLALVAGCALVVHAAPGMAYRDYSGNDGSSNCANSTCHGGFRDGGGDSLHSLHVGNSEMTNNCDLCHFGDGNGNFEGVLIGWSGEDPDHACTGCHEFGGLLARHTGISGCGCHNPHPAALPENIIPPYYGRGDVSLVDPCLIDPNNGGEDFDGDGLGLDNDGDGVFDANDPDCVGVSNQEHSWGSAKSSYGAE